MRAILRLLLLILILFSAGLLSLAWFGLAEQALVVNDTHLSHKDIARAKVLLRQHDPRTLGAGSRRSIQVSEQDLNLAANYLLQKYTRGGARVSIQPGVLRLAATAHLAPLPIRPYLNVSLKLTGDDDSARVSQLTIGEIRVPDTLAQWLISEALQQAYQSRQYRLASDMIQEMRLDDGQLRISYEWRPELLERMRSELLSDAERQAIPVYHQQLLELQRQGLAGRGSLARLMPEMFRLAHNRSRQPGADPVSENRALLIVLGSWAGGHGLDQLLPPAAAEPWRFRMHLERRLDFAQHFLISAALVAAGDDALADAVGLYKEMADADGGSGFSFTDIAADRAGSRFGRMATTSTEQALRLQQLISETRREADFMPAIRDLPEHMKGSEFERRFGGVDHPAYQRMIAEIDRRIAACPLYQN